MWSEDMINTTRPTITTSNSTSTYHNPPKPLLALPRLTVPKQPTAVEIPLSDEYLPPEIQDMVEQGRLEQIYYYEKSEGCPSCYVLKIKQEDDKDFMVYEFFFVMDISKDSKTTLNA